MKTYVEVDVYIHVFLTSVLVKGEWSASCPGRFNPRRKSPCYPLDRRLIGPQNRSGRRGEEKNIAPTGTQLQPLGHQTRSQSRIDENYEGISATIIGEEC
jgi:hypothetical protein